MTPQNYTSLQKKARSKFITRALIFPLLKLNSDLNDSYRAAYYCANDIEVHEGGKTITKYCGQRWCLACARIRIAKNINNYSKQISEFPSPVFLTLTIPNPIVYRSNVFCKGQLKSYFDVMFSELLKIKDLYRKKINVKIKGIVKFETTINIHYGELHPHLHLIIDTKTAANFIYEQWFKRFPECSKFAQDKTEFNHTQEFREAHLVEIFKYMAKQVYTIQTKKNENKRVNPHLYLDYIYTELKNLRLIRAWGIKIPIIEDSPEKLESQFEAIEATTGLYQWVENDWIHTSGKLGFYNENRTRNKDFAKKKIESKTDLPTGETLSGFNPDENLQKFANEVSKGYNHTGLKGLTRSKKYKVQTSNKQTKELKPKSAKL